MTIYPGAVVDCRVPITNRITGAAVDPTTLVCRVQNPAGTITEYAYPGPIARLAVGSFQLDVAVPNVNDNTAVGLWYVRWRGTGAGAGSGEVWFRVTASQLSTP